MIFAATWRVTGEPAERRMTMPFTPGHDPFSPEYEAWYVDTRRSAVAALWQDGILWRGAACRKREVTSGFRILRTPALSR